MELYAQILEVITHYPEGVRITRPSYGVGVPVDRLKTMVEALRSKGLVSKISTTDEVRYGATPRGMEFLDTYSKMRGFFEIFGERT